MDEKVATNPYVATYSICNIFIMNTTYNALYMKPQTN